MIEYAIEQAKKLPIEKDRQRLYAVLTDKKGNILAEASNDYDKSHPFQAKYAKMLGMEEKIYKHAEIATLIKIVTVYKKKHLIEKAHTLYVARVGKTQQVMNACPCPICQKALNDFNIENIVHT